MAASNPANMNEVFHVMADSPCNSLVGRLRDICTGDAKGVSRSLRNAYIDLWLSDGTLQADPRIKQSESHSSQQPSVAMNMAGNEESRNSFANPCRHRGDQIRSAHCKPCQSRSGSSEEVPVFSCFLHRECTILKTGLPVRGCNLCDDRQSRPIKLLWLSSDLSKGGVSRYFKTVIDALPKDVVTTAVAFSTFHEKMTDADLAGQLRKLGIRVVCTDQDVEKETSLKFPEIEFCEPAIYDSLIDESDVVTTAINNPHVLCRSDWRGKAVVAQLHSVCDETTRIGRAMDPYATLFCVTSEESRRNAVSKIGLDDFRIRVIELAVDLNRIASWKSTKALRKDIISAADSSNLIQEAESAKWLLYFGRFSPEKRIPEIAEAIKELNSRQQGAWIGVFAGDGWAASRIRPKIILSAPNHSLMVPWGTPIGDLLAASDVFVCNSEFEGGPTTSLEALLSGIPVISTQVGILQDAEGSHIPIIAPSSPAAVADAAIKATGLRKPAERLDEDHLRAARFRSRFCARRMSDEFANVIAEAYFLNLTKTRAAAQTKGGAVSKPASEPPLPSITKMAANFVKSAASHVASGMPPAPFPVYSARVAACRSCPLFRPSDERCSECGCYVTKKAKMLDQDCPHPDGSRWPNLTSFVQENQPESQSENGAS